MQYDFEKPAFEKLRSFDHTLSMEVMCMYERQIEIANHRISLPRSRLYRKCNVLSSAESSERFCHLADYSAWLWQYEGINREQIKF